MTTQNGLLIFLGKAGLTSSSNRMKLETKSKQRPKAGNQSRQAAACESNFFINLLFFIFSFFQFLKDFHFLSFFVIILLFFQFLFSFIFFKKHFISFDFIFLPVIFIFFQCRRDCYLSFSFTLHVLSLSGFGAGCSFMFIFVHFQMFVHARTHSCSFMFFSFIFVHFRSFSFIFFVAVGCSRSDLLGACTFVTIGSGSTVLM